MDTGKILFFIGITAAVIFILHFLSVKRRKKMAAYAKARGWKFWPEKDRTVENKYPAFQCLRRGHTRYAFNQMRGEVGGREVTAFDYHYVTGHGKSRSVHNFSALIIQSPIRLKPLLLRPENIFDKMTDFFGYNDIDFESAEFSRKFYVKAKDKRWAYDVIHPRMIEYLLKAPKFSIQLDTGNGLAWKCKRFSERDFDDAFELIEGILDRIPEYVKKQLNSGRLESEQD